MFALATHGEEQVVYRYDVRGEVRTLSMLIFSLNKPSFQCCRRPHQKSRPISHQEPLGNHVPNLTFSSSLGVIKLAQPRCQVQDEGVNNHRDKRFSVGFPGWAAGISQET